MTRAKSLVIYLTILTALCAAFIIGMMALGQQGMYLAQGYMLTPALAALITRLFFYEGKFRDANLRPGRFQDHVRFWLVSLGITALSFLLFTLFGAVSWDLSGSVFLERLTEQFAASGQDIHETLPPGLTPRRMLMIFFVGGLTVFNILPGLITGFGEEFGHRGFMFPALYAIQPKIGIIVGGLIWYVWHWPVVLVAPQAVDSSAWQTLLNFLLLGIGSIFTFTYLAYVYVKSRSVWVTSLAHIVLNNSAASLSYFATVQNQVLANLGLMLAMAIVVLVLYASRELRVFEHFRPG